MSMRKLVFMAMLIALSVVLVAFVHFPIFAAAPYLEYDPADIPILIGTFAFGPVAGLVLTVLVSLIQGLTVSAGSGIYGIIMHIIATGTFVLVSGFIYKYKKTRLGAVIALAAGMFAMAFVMAFANLIVTPQFTGMSVEAIEAILLPIIIPFNLIKAGINAVITFIVYKSISKYVFKGNFGRKKTENQG